jgi:hypothetical protein
MNSFKNQDFMRKLSAYTLFSFSLALVVMFSNQVFAQSTPVDYCIKDNARESAMKKLKPFRYSGFKTKPITIKEYNQVKETLVTILKDVPYRLIFNSEGLPEGQKVEIAIYDKPFGKKNRNVIYEYKGADKEVIFDTKDASFTEMYVEYVFPAFEGKMSSDMAIKGCVTMTIGYNNLIIEGGETKK